MNILFLSNHLNIGGISSYLLSLSKGLKQAGHNIYLASSEGELIEEFKQQGASFISIPIKTKAEINPMILISAFKLLPIIKKEKIDLIQANTRVTQVLACILSKISGVPFIYTCHGYFRNNLSRKIFPCWGKKTIAISQAVKEHLVNDFGVAAENICLIPNGVDIEKAQKSSRIELGLGQGLIVGIIGRLSDVKGHIYLIRAMSAVVKQIADVKLLIVGEGKTEFELKSLVNELGLDKKVFFIPSVNDTSHILNSIDLFVMPSLKEGLGLSLMEAMACGLAVIGTSVGGIKNLIKNNENGLLVNPANPDELSAAIIALLKDEVKRKVLGQRAKKFIAENYSLQGMIKKTEGCFQGCLES